MTISVFEIFKIGIGPSSSHTVGPMHAAGRFARQLQHDQLLHQTYKISIDLYGSLGATGKGHGTDKAVLLGLEGELPESIDPDCVEHRIDTIANHGRLNILQQHSITFDINDHLVFHRKALPFHANGMRFNAFLNKDSAPFSKNYYSVGGGFIVGDQSASANRVINTKPDLPYSFLTAESLLDLCNRHQVSISDIMLTNEKSRQNETEIRKQLLNIWSVMKNCVQRGIKQTGTLPGGMKVKRRAAGLYQQLTEKQHTLPTPMGTLDWVNLYALAVSEENAASGRVVTAPTNGAAGIIPAVLHYYRQFCSDANDEGVMRFLLTAAAIAILYKENASLSGAVVGCQGEIGVACSMAAGALTEVLGGTPQQVENAAEIGMEHNLGLTCDPIGGLVQVPCIERNAMGAVKAINASRIALRGDGTHFVSLDKVIRTMRQTGADMQSKYKETSRGGLAVNIIEC